MSGSTIPQVACDWICKCCLANRHAHLSNRLSSMGLSRLSVMELKQVAERLSRVPSIYSSPHNNSKLRGYRSKRKADLMQAIRSCFYTDHPTCSEEDEVVLREIGNLAEAAATTTSTTATTTTAAASAARAVAAAAATAAAPMAAARVSNPYAVPRGSAAAARNNNTHHARAGGSAAAAAATRVNHPYAVPPMAAARALQQQRGPLLFPPSSAMQHNDYMMQLFQMNGIAVPFQFGGIAVNHAAMTGGAMNSNSRTVVDLSTSPSPPASSSSGRQHHHHHHHNRKRSRTENGSGSGSDVYIKPESAIGDPDATPANDHEKFVLGQLQQMSFTDPHEILDSYRKLKRQRMDNDNNNNPNQHGSNTAAAHLHAHAYPPQQLPGVDDVMFDIIASREEAEEARLMDHARKLSESTRKEEARQRREEQQRKLHRHMETSTVDTWKSDPDCFPHSWILQWHNNLQQQQVATTTTTAAAQKLAADRTCTPLKKLIIELLLWEKKARQWYGNTLPRSYFCRLAQRWQNNATFVKDETERLETVMMKLSEQVGGVPKVFRDAHDQFQYSLHQENNDDESDDDVILLTSEELKRQPPASPSRNSNRKRKRRSTPRSSPRRKTDQSSSSSQKLAAVPHEVIEISD